MELVIAEKPSVAQSIAAVLGATQRKDGYLEGNEYLVSWCVGHLVELAQPESYEEAWLVGNLAQSDHLGVEQQLIPFARKAFPEIRVKTLCENIPAPCLLNEAFHVMRHIEGEFPRECLVELMAERT